MYHHHHVSSCTIFRNSFSQAFVSWYGKRKSVESPLCITKNPYFLFWNECSPARTSRALHKCMVSWDGKYVWNDCNINNSIAECRLQIKLWANKTRRHTATIITFREHSHTIRVHATNRATITTNATVHDIPGDRFALSCMKKKRMSDAMSEHCEVQHINCKSNFY